MKLENNYAIVENLAEYEFFEKDSANDNLEIGYIKTVIDNKYIKVTKEQVKEKLQLKKEQDFFSFSKDDLKKDFIRLPTYITGYQTRYKRKNIFMLPVNILTINKSIHDLYELGKWCNLWE
jgi:hypothetical protein